jgi:exodeoxyribonuclease VII large subunit
LKFKPQDGIAVLARGRIDLYEARGEYQLLVEMLEPQGHGALQFAFEQLKKRLQSEGLFDDERKRSLPPLPQRIGVVTSPSGAAVLDIVEILTRRFPGIHVRIYPALVQGEGSAETVVRALDYFSESDWAEVVILARGGGSLEDLWTFNEEPVARAIARSSVPVISAIGHESDFTIADFVADLRAPTPSAAAELVICSRDQLLAQIDTFDRHLAQSARYRIAMDSRRLHQQGVERAAAILHRKVGRLAQRIDELDYRLRSGMAWLVAERKKCLADSAAHLGSLDLRLRLARARQRLDRVSAEATRAIGQKVTRANARLEPAIAHLTQLSPLKILERGYAIVTDAAGRVLTDPAQVPAGSVIEARLAKGSLQAEVRPLAVIRES